MTVATVKSVAERYLKNSKPEVLALKGAWGVGKTYTWNQIVESHKNDTGLKYYCYISLFSVSSISQLALSIFTKTKEIKLVGNKIDANTINKHWFALGKVGLKKVGKFLSDKSDLPHVKNISIGLEQIAPYMIKDTIVCLDDFERMNSQLSAEEILGFISYLKEEKNCKVVLIFNEEQLKEKESVYKKYREKIIDIELLFAPSPIEAINCAFNENLPCREMAEQSALKLKIVNIRLLRKISDLIDLITPELINLHPEVMQQAVSTLVILAWAYYDISENKPDFAFILKWERMIWGSDKTDENKDDQKNKEWAAILIDYGLTHIDEFDYAISKVIEQGHIEETGLVKEAAKLNAQLHARDLETSFSEAWKLFHNSFSDNKDELIVNLRDSFKKSYLQVSPSNLNATVRLLRQLERDDIANEIIDYYIEKRNDDQNIFDLDNYAFSSDIDDTILRERFKLAFTTGRQLPTLLDAVTQIAEQHGWSQEQIQVVEKASEEDYFQLFMQNQGDNLSKVIRACLQFETISGYQHIAQKPRAALERIGSQSKLNAQRVRKFGVMISTTTK